MACARYLLDELGLALLQHGPHGFLQQSHRARVEHPPPEGVHDEVTGAKPNGE